VVLEDATDTSGTWIVIEKNGDYCFTDSLLWYVSHVGGVIFILCVCG
jgi:hypothetical protein